MVNKHPKLVADFIRKNKGNTSYHAIDIAKFENSYGEEKIIHLTASGLAVKRDSSTVSVELNKKIAQLVSAKIKELRLSKGMTMVQLHDKAGLSSSTPKSRMWEIENASAKRGLRMGTLYAIAIALEVSPGDILPSIEDVLQGAVVEKVTETTLKVKP